MIRQNVIPVVIIAALTVTGCEQGSQAPSLSLDEAKEVTAAFAGSDFTPPPRSIQDITAMFEDSRSDTDHLIRLRKVADREPPASKHPNTLAAFYLKRARASRDIGRTQQQLADLRLAHAALASGVNPSIRMQVFRRLAFAEIRAGRANRSIPLLEQALDSAQGDGWRLTIHANLVMVHSWRGELKRAEEHLTEVRRLYADNRGWRYAAQKALAAFAQGEIDHARGRQEEAVRSFRTAVDALQNDSQFRNSYFHLAIRNGSTRALLAQGRAVEAEALMRENLSISLERMGRYSGRTGFDSFRMVQALADQGRYPDATKIGGITLDIFNRLDPGSIGALWTHGLLSDIAVAQGEWKTAVDEFDRIIDKTRNEPDTFKSYFAGYPGYALALVEIGQGREALDYVGPAYAEASAQLGSKHYRTAELQAVRGLAQALIGERARALEDLQAAIPVLLARSRESRAGDQSVTIRDQRKRWIIEGYLELLTAEESISLARKAGIDPVSEAFRVMQVARTHTVQRALAESSARVALKDTELAALARREQDTQKQISAHYGLLVNMHAQARGRVDAVSEANLRGRIDELRGARSALMQEIERRFPQYARLLDPKPLSLDQARAHLRPSEALIAIYVGADQSYVWALPYQGQMAFKVVPLGKTRLAAMVRDLRRALEPDAATLGDIPRFNFHLARQLYKDLLAPVKDSWQKARSLLVVADGPLGQLPLSLLLTEDTAPGTDQEVLFEGYRSLPWLARSHAVTVLPSTVSLATLRGLPPAAEARFTFAGFGDPLFSAEQASESEAVQSVALTSRSLLATRSLPLRRRNRPGVDALHSAELGKLQRLPDTAEELKSIALALKADLTRNVFTGKAANEQTVKNLDLTEYRVVAFATHGLVPGDLNGLTQPALALSAPEVAGVPGDGLLTLGEILGLKLNADWVLLSACNTAAGDGAGAEAISGLGRAFFYAGARSILVSNWPVETTSAKALTTDIFRRQAADPGLSRAEALRQAMLGLIDGAGFQDDQGRTVFSYAHPIFWAPFSLTGDGGKPQPAS